MLEPTTNQTNSQLTPEEAKASLGVATRIMDEIMQAQNPNIMEGNRDSGNGQEITNNDVSQETLEETQEPESESIQSEEVSQEQSDIVKEFESFKGEIKGIVETKFDELTKTIKDALK